MRQSPCSVEVEERGETYRGVRGRSASEVLLSGMAERGTETPGGVALGPYLGQRSRYGFNGAKEWTRRRCALARCAPYPRRHTVPLAVPKTCAAVGTDAGAR